MSNHPLTLVYHFLTDGSNGIVRQPVEARPYYLDLSIFDRHLAFLAHGRFQALSVTAFLRLFEKDPLGSTNQIIITFDDGHLSNYRLAFPLLKRYDFLATFYVVPTWVGTEQYMNWKQIRELANAGMEIGSHTLTHPYLTELTKEKVRSEFAQSKQIIEDQIQQPCHSLAIPYGFNKPEYEQIAKECGYKGVCDSKVSFQSQFQSTFSRIHRMGVRSHNDVRWLRLLVESKWTTRLKMVLYDRLKNSLKRTLKLDSWLTLRTGLLTAKYKMRKHIRFSSIG
ncbi:MAG: polysaccharide deacetylase family protein [bacterium]